MKKILILFFALIMIFALSASADTYVFYDEFDSNNFVEETLTENVIVENSKAIFSGNKAQAELPLCIDGNTSNPGIDVSESGTIIVEMKITVTEEGRANMLPEFLGRTDLNEAPVSVTTGKIQASKKFLIGNQSTGLELSKDATYILQYKLDFLNNEGWLTITDEEGNTYTNESADDFKDIGKLLTLDKLVFKSHNTKGMSFELDYIKISDNSFKILSLDVEDDEIVPIDRDIVFKLNGSVDESTLSNITVKCGDEDVPYKISKNESGAYVLYFPYGLSYNKDYTLTLPNTIKSEGEDGIGLYERTINFKTEMAPYYVKDLSISDLGETSASLSGTFINNTSTAQEASVVVTIYNSNNKIVHTYYKKHTALIGETVLSETIDLTGVTDAVSAKVYVWNNIFGMNDILVLE